MSGVNSPHLPEFLSPCYPLVALLAPNGSGGFKLYGEPSYLVAGQPSARIIQSDGHWFIRKGEKVAATPERTAELDTFAAELANALLAVA